MSPDSAESRGVPPRPALFRQGVERGTFGYGSNYLRERRIDKLALGINVHREILLVAAWAVLLRRLNHSGLIFLQARQGGSSVRVASPMLSGTFLAFVRRHHSWSSCPIPRGSRNKPTIVVRNRGAIGHRVPCSLFVAVASDERYPMQYIFDTEVFSPDAVSRLCELLDGVLTSVADDPQIVVGDLPLTISRGAEAPLPNDSRSVRADPPLLHQFLEETAHRTPRRVALVDSGRQLTYGELDVNAEALAIKIRHRVTRPQNSVVAVRLPRGIEQIIALCGILKAGAAFLHLPVAEDWESERTQQRVLSAVRPSLIVQLGDSIGDLRLLSGSPDSHAQDSPRAETELLREISVDATAYISATSGSSGSPVLVAKSHSMYSRGLLAERKLHVFGANERFLYREVASYRQLFIPLSSGAVLVIAQDGRERDIEYLASLLVEEKVTVATLSPRILQELLAVGFFSRVHSLRHVSVGGAPLWPALETQLRLEFGLEVHHGYSMTEADNICLRSLPPLAASDRPVLGRPVDMQVAICDQTGAVLPNGLIGSIYVGGPGLASGYIRLDGTEPLQTHCVGDVPLFKTGDFGRVLPTREVEFAGRVEEYADVDGVPVWLAEVEERLRGHEAVHSAGVVSSPCRPSELHAFVVAQTRVSEDELASWVKLCLGDEAVPHSWHFMRSLPLRESKLDRRALKERCK